ncbi:HCLS1-associated protein X-1 [Paramormyrops kingsleyae]|uniref:HCLS1 associated protein X-1 n=2 Tax=Paramormyrops kingsleyae TaxID=1676925 RepID=A0A3B3STQ8_9TELE|nr:HCLS1-associated protein X-1 [Paramormyrops kingsleyae]
MSIFDLFRGFFGVPGGRYSGSGRRDPFFDGLTHDDDEDDDEDDDFGSAYEARQHDPFDDALRFGFSFGPSGFRIEEPQVFGQVLQEMEEVFSFLNTWDRQPGFRHFGVPQIEAPPPEDNMEHSGRGGKAGSLRDFMLKSPDQPAAPPTDPPPSRHWMPFSKFNDRWSRRLKKEEETDAVREDRDLDSQVSTKGLEEILSPSPTPSQPTVRSFSQSVMITKVVTPDGAVEERRTVRDSHGNEETTITRSRGPQSQQEPPEPGVLPPSDGLGDASSIFSKFFGGFRG